MRVVSENSEADIKRNRALDVVGVALRDLAANLMRVTRGAGKPYDVGPQATALLKAMEQYREAVGHYPTNHEVSAQLSIRDPEADQAFPDEFDRLSAEHSIVSGALQITASKLVDQRTQEAAGRNELYDGLNIIEQLRQAERNRQAETARIKRSQEKNRKPPKASATQRNAARPSKAKKPLT